MVFLTRLTLAIAASFLLTSALPATDTAATASERDVALWVLREGGRVRLDGASEYTGDPFDLPAGDLHVVGVDLHGTVVDPKELAPLARLTGLREMYLPARIWSPVSDVKSPYSDEMFD